MAHFSQYLVEYNTEMYLKDNNWHD